MKTSEQKQLLRDVLHEESYGAFREAVRETSLRELRRKRATRGTPWLALAASVVLAIGVYWIIHSPSRLPEIAAVVDIVRSVPLRKDQILTTAAHTSVASVRSPQEDWTASVVVIRSGDGSMGEVLSDEQLLAFFKDRPVALLSLGNGSKTLLLLDEQGEPGETIQP